MVRIPAALGLLSIALFFGCKGDTDPEETADSACQNSIVETFPAAGATGVYYRSTVEAKFDDADDGATITLTGPSGDVAGSSAWNGKFLVLTPSEPLAANTDYSFTITYECGTTDAISFRTSEVGAPLADAGSLVGNTYSLNLGSGRFIKPPGVGPLLKEYITTEVLVGVTGVTGTQIDMVGAIAVEGSNPPAQAPCQPSIPFPTADFSENPYFAIEADKSAITVQGITVEINDLVISGAFAPDASYISGAVLKGTIDTRPLVPLLDPEGGDSAICDLATTIGVACEPCKDGGNFCLSLFVDNIDAEKVPGTLEVIVDACTEKPDVCADSCESE